MGEKWRRPGGKFRELGPSSLTKIELLAILISPSIKGRPVELIAADLLNRSGSLKGSVNQTFASFTEC